MFSGARADSRFLQRICSCLGLLTGSRCSWISSHLLPCCFIPRAKRLSSASENFTLSPLSCLGVSPVLGNRLWWGRSSIKRNTLLKVAIIWMLVSDGDGRRSSVRSFERLAFLAAALPSFLGTLHFRGLGVLRFVTKALLTILQQLTCWVHFTIIAAILTEDSRKKVDFTSHQQLRLQNVTISLSENQMFLTTLTSSLLFLNALPIPCSLKKNLYKITAVTQRSVHFTLAAKDRVRVLTWLLSYVQSKNTFYSLGPGACFSKVPSIYGSRVITLDFIQRNNNASLG